MLEPAFALVERLLYRRFPRLYRTFYSAYKALSDRDERRLYGRLVKPGMTVIDVGANIGACTAVFARRVGPSGRVRPVAG